MEHVNVRLRTKADGKNKSIEEEFIPDHEDDYVVEGNPDLPCNQQTTTCR